MTLETKFDRRDWTIAIAVFLVALALRVPFRSRLAFHWDSAQFALAIQHYNISMSLPHIPGFFLYVMLGRLVNLLVGEPHASLVWISVFSGAAVAGLGYLLATALFGRECGLITGCLLASSPLCWFQSEVVFSTLPDCVLVMLTILACWRAIQRGGSWPWVVVVAVALALEAGIRQQTTPMLCPVWVYTFWRFPRPRWRKFVVAVLIVGLVCTAWFIPMVYLSGGLGAYLQLYPARVRLDAPLTPWGGGLEALTQNLAFIAATCWIGLLGAALLGLAECYSWATKKRDRQFTIASRGEQLRFLAVWVVPMVILGIVGVTVMPGYVLCYFPGLVILVALALGRLAGRIASVLGLRRSYALGIIVGGLMFINGAVFLLPPQQTEWLRVNLRLTATHLREHDRQLGGWFEAIRMRFRPDEVLLCHEGENYYWGFRQFEYHLPEYENCLLTKDSALLPPMDKKLWYAKDRNVEFVDHFELRGRKTLILVVPPGMTIDAFTNVFDVTLAKMWEIPGGPPLYTLTARSP